MSRKSDKNLEMSDSSNLNKYRRKSTLKGFKIIFTLKSY